MAYCEVHVKSKDLLTNYFIRHKVCGLYQQQIVFCMKNWNLNWKIRHDLHLIAKNVDSEICSLFIHALNWSLSLIFTKLLCMKIKIYL